MAIQTPIWSAIQQRALADGLDAKLIGAIIHQESSGHPYALRYEDGFFLKYLKGHSLSELKGYIPRLCSCQTELRARACSFGLMQIMGQVAREVGFKGEYLTELIDIKTNLEFGCKYLAKCLEKGGTVEKGLLYWNGGANKNYPAQVLGHLDSGVYDYLCSQ
jgi:soluble lytic murein transglycosylase-like protein